MLDLGPGHALAEMMLASQPSMRCYAADGFRTVFNTNRDAGQTVFHIHLHVIGGRALGWPPG